MKSIVLNVMFLTAFAFAYDFCSNVYAKMLFYTLFAVNLTLFTARFNLMFGFLLLIAVCVYPAFSIAYKIFLFGLALGVANGKLHGRMSSFTDTIAGVAIFIGIVWGLYNFLS